MSHVAAYTGSEALSGVMLDIVLHPHTVTQIPLPQLFIYLFLGGGGPPNLSISSKRSENLLFFCLIQDLCAR